MYRSLKNKKPYHNILCLKLIWNILQHTISIVKMKIFKNNASIVDPALHNWHHFLATLKIATSRCPIFSGLQPTSKIYLLSDFIMGCKIFIIVSAYVYIADIEQKRKYIPHQYVVVFEFSEFLLVPWLKLFLGCKAAADVAIYPKLLYQAMIADKSFILSFS